MSKDTSSQPRIVWEGVVYHKNSSEDEGTIRRDLRIVRKAATPAVLESSTDKDEMGVPIWRRVDDGEEFSLDEDVDKVIQVLVDAIASHAEG